MCPERHGRGFFIGIFVRSGLRSRLADGPASCGLTHERGASCDGWHWWQRIPRGRHAAPNAEDPSTFLPRVIEAEGYHTWHMGKSGNGFMTGLKEFKTNIIDDARGETNPKNSRAHAPQRLADRAIEFLKSRRVSAVSRNSWCRCGGSSPGPAIGGPGLLGGDDGLT